MTSTSPSSTAVRRPVARFGRSLRICMLTTFYPPYHFGGDAVTVHRLSEALAAAGHRVDVVYSRDAYHALGGGEPGATWRDHANVRRREIHTTRPLLGALLAHQLGTPAVYDSVLRDLLASGRYDVIHYHNVSLLGGPGLLSLGRAVKLYTPHDYWLVCPTSGLAYFEREPCVAPRCMACVLAHRKPPQLWRYLPRLSRALAHVDLILPPSRFALERHRAAGITRPMQQLPDLVDEPRPTTQAGAQAPPEKPYFLFAGRLEKLKGVHDLLTLFADYRAADLLVVGAGAQAAPLRERARDLEHVRFLDAITPDALVPLYERALAVLVPSLCYETFCLSAAESIRLGTPAIVRDHGALREIVTDSGGGLRFTTLDECRDAMERVRTDPALRARLADQGRRFARRHWATEVGVDRYLSIVDHLLRMRA